MIIVPNKGNFETKYVNYISGAEGAVEYNCKLAHILRQMHFNNLVPFRFKQI